MIVPAHRAGTFSIIGIARHVDHPHFTFDEMTVSQLAARDGFDNTTPEARANLQLLCCAGTGTCTVRRAHHRQQRLSQ
jgi:hypothetical protein